MSHPSLHLGSLFSNATGQLSRGLSGYGLITEIVLITEPTCAFPLHLHGLELAMSITSCKTETQSHQEHACPMLQIAACFVLIMWYFGSQSMQNSMARGCTQIRLG